MNVLSYNTERGQLLIPEYGRNIQNMIDYATKIKSREERNKAAKAIIDVMGQINPHLRDVEDYNHKLWTHLYIMSDFKIDVDSPYEIPAPEKLKEKPKRLHYPKNSGKYGHFGYYSEKIIQEVTKMEDPEEKAYFTQLMGDLLKKDYLTFHTNNVEDVAIVAHLRELSGGKLHLAPEALTATNTILKQSGIQISNNPKRLKRKKSKKRKK